MFGNGLGLHFIQAEEFIKLIIFFKPVWVVSSVILIVRQHVHRL
jgi:hypothetical protein